MDIENNEYVDKMAKMALNHPHQEIHRTRLAFLALLEGKLINQKQDQASEVSAFYRVLHSRKYDLDLNRKQRVLLRQLRSNGHCNLLNSYKHRIGRTKSSVCDCGANEIEDVEHWLKGCRKNQSARKKINPAILTKDSLWTSPHIIVKLLGNH